MVIVAGLVIRAAVMFHPGHREDLRLFEGWAEKGATHGVLNIYDPALPGIQPDYPPLLLFVYTAAGETAGALQGHFRDSELFVGVIKLPALIADVVIACMLVACGTLVATRYHGIIAAALYFILPASWLDSAVWGQMDPIYAALVLWMFVAAGKGRFVMAGVAAGLAAGSKFQVVAFLPMLAVIAAASGSQALRKGLTSFGLTLAAAFLPFIIVGQFENVLHAYTHAVGAYGVLSVDAFNMWQLFFGESARSISDLHAAGGLSYRTWSLIVFAAGLVVAMAAVWREARRPGISRLDLALRAAAVTSLIFFIFPTEIHDRYLFPFLALAAIWATRGRKEMAAYLVLSVATAFNIAYPLSISVTDQFFRLVPLADRLFALSIVVVGLGSIPMLIKSRRSSPSPVDTTLRTEAAPSS